MARDLKFLTTYWKEFSKYSSYEVYCEGDFLNPILTTKTGNKVVGTIHNVKQGTAILLPPIRYDEESFITYNEDSEDLEVSWTEEAIEFGKRLASCIIDIDVYLRGLRQSTPSPEWSRQDEYRMKRETLLENKIKGLTKKIETMLNERSESKTFLEKEGGLRRLLFEKGNQLEDAILDALQILGFDAKRFQNSDSDFDALFTSSEGRFLGEAEGKDNKAISIDKLSQLERNLQEDFAREDVSDYAKGVLFGNAFRLQPPSERSEFFTEKCLSGARRSKIALVRTIDLFKVAKYLKENRDVTFANKCRQILKTTEGVIVKFPDIPITNNLKVKNVKKDSTTN